jgi:hypothetical protein
MVIIEREELTTLSVSYCKFNEVDKRCTQKWPLRTDSTSVGLQFAQCVSYLCKVRLCRNAVKLRHSALSK